jgi:hypothetical protein
MPDENPTRDAGKYDTPEWLAGRVIVLQLLRDDHDERWTLGELERAASDLGRRAVRDSIRRLKDEGVIVALDGHFLASRCARYLDWLGLIGV